MGLGAPWWCHQRLSGPSAFHPKGSFSLAGGKLPFLPQFHSPHPKGAGVGRTREEERTLGEVWVECLCWKIPWQLADSHRPGQGNQEAEGGDEPGHGSMGPEGHPWAEEKEGWLCVCAPGVLSGVADTV